MPRRLVGSLLGCLVLLGAPLTARSSDAAGGADSSADLAAARALVAAARDAARALGSGDRLGTIEPGKAADLLVLAADPAADVAAFRRLELVVRGGEVRSIAELRPPQP
jgi:cytosine/adenosine deaminase-related metal-dependent hydrolase